MGEHNVLHSFSIKFLKCTNFQPWLRWHCKELSRNTTTEPWASFSNTSAHPNPGSRKRTRGNVENSQQEPSALTFTSCMDTITTQIIIFNLFSSSGLHLFINVKKHFVVLGKRGGMEGMEGMDGGDADGTHSIPDTCQETTRGPREELQQEAIPASPAGHRESGTGRMPTLLHLPCSTFHSQPGRKNPSVILLNSS